MVVFPATPCWISRSTAHTSLEDRNASDLILVYWCIYTVASVHDYRICWENPLRVSSVSHRSAAGSISVPYPQLFLTVSAMIGDERNVADCGSDRSPIILYHGWHHQNTRIQSSSIQQRRPSNHRGLQPLSCSSKHISPSFCPDGALSSAPCWCFIYCSEALFCSYLR